MMRVNLIIRTSFQARIRKGGLGEVGGYEDPPQ